MNLLRIDSSVRVKNSKTRQLTDCFFKELQKRTSIDVKLRDVGLQPPSFPTDEFIKANYTNEENRSQEMKNLLQESDILISELFEADRIVIAAPMYNFSIPASLKAWVDNIVRINKTFSLDKNGAMTGLLKNKKALVITSRGAMSYKAGEQLHNFDFQQNYLNALLNFIGVSDITFVNTEAQDFGSEEVRENNFSQSMRALEDLAKTW